MISGQQLRPGMTRTQVAEQPAWELALEQVERLTGYAAAHVKAQLAPA